MGSEGAYWPEGLLVLVVPVMQVVASMEGGRMNKVLGVVVLEERMAA